MNDELRLRLLGEIELLQNAPCECDGMTSLVVTAISRYTSNYTVYCGEVASEAGSVFSPHFWVEFDGLIIDYCAKMWLGDDAQHGLLDASKYGHLYRGVKTTMTPLSPTMEVILKTPFPTDFLEMVAKQNTKNLR